MDPTIRLAAERVKAWHLARFLAHVEPPEPTQTPPSVPDAPDRVAPIIDPPAPDISEPGQDAAPRALRSTRAGRASSLPF